ncbi:hypothetical protein GQX73_g8840 [Xylaria multiplex]|uniref:PHD-type domain-containing protein n=1 Tax=Xylaria multiplex TaxID=323545 RepID=A0A7C8MPJ7_9PEZI|nr:hypothetical protein GQX73_g8840 [Xylaria multiplex]
MSSSHPKPTRSRFSSPHRHSSSSATHGQSQGRGGNTDASRTFMQRWLEPPVQNKPSFQEAGLIRGGVVENMAPLGTMPKTAVLKKTPLSGADGSPPNLCTDAITTPSATTTPPDITRIPSSEAAGVMEDVTTDALLLSPTSHLALPLPVVDDMNDDDYVPKKSKARRISQNPHANNASSASTPPLHPRRQSHRHRSARSSPAPAILDPTPNPTPDPTPVPTSPTRSETPSFHQLAREPDDKEQANKIVEIAVEEALRHFRYPTAWALRLLYDQNSGDPHFVSMIEDIYYQRATPKTIHKFRRLIGEKKKEGKKENKGCYYFVPPSTGGHLAPHKPEPAPYEKLIKMEFASLLRDSASDVDVDADGHVNKKRKTEGEEGRTMPVDQANAHPDLTTATNGGGSRRQKNGDHHHSHSYHARGGVTKDKSPRGKKTRSGSVSSTSSLSSVPDDAIEDYDDFMDSVDGDSGASRMEDEHAEGNNAQIPASSMQPISIVSPNPALEQNTPPPITATTTTTTHHPRSRDSSMPAAVITTVATTNGTPHHHTNQSIPTLKFQSRFGDFDESTDTFVRKKLSRKSETAINTKSASLDSFVREPLELDELPQEPVLPPQPPAPPPEHARLSRTPAPALSSRAARAAKRNHDEFDDASSPTASSFRADFEPSSARNSRAATPTNPRSSKKPRGGLRVKTSPMKKKGTSAGIPRGNGERPSPVGNGIPNNQDDNDDSCYTCGGNGELVCCDGCTFSFHFTCIDPPMDEGRIPDEWFCNECQIRYNPPHVNEHRSVFSSLVANLQRKNPRAFRLPEPIREYFEGVKTGAEGEYEEAVPPKPNRGLANNGWIEVEEDDSDDDDEAAWKEKKAFGRVFRVSARGIKRDFISRVHQNRGDSDFRPRIVDDPAPRIAPKLPSLEQQQAALTLLQLVQGQGDGVHQLAQAMISQASPAAISLMARGDAQRIADGSLANADIATLETVLAQADALKQRVSKILEGRTNHACFDKSDTELKALTPSSISREDSAVVDELKLEPGSSQDTEKGQDTDGAKPAPAPAMRLD